MYIYDIKEYTRMKKWTITEIDFLISNYNKNGLKYCSEYLNLDKGVVRYQSRKLGLKDGNFYEKWTDDEIKLLKEYYPKGLKECKKYIKKDDSAIYSKASYLKIIFPSLKRVKEPPVKIELKWQRQASSEKRIIIG